MSDLNSRRKGQKRRNTAQFEQSTFEQVKIGQPTLPSKGQTGVPRRSQGDAFNS